VLLPVALGEGVLGAACACAALAFARARAGGAGALGLAALVLLAGLHPLASRRDAELAPVAADPVVVAALSSERDLASPLDRLAQARCAARSLAAALALASGWRRARDRPIGGSR
jgi:hypothetical protein